MSSLVYCQRESGEIAEGACETMQSAIECRGCAAPSRRCTKCGCRRALANLELGLCKLCHRDEESISVDQTPERPSGIQQTSPMAEPSIGSGAATTPGWPHGQIPGSVANAIAALPKDEAEALQLRLGIGWEKRFLFAEVADLLGLSKSTLSTLHTRALQHLQQNISDEDFLRVRDSMPRGKLAQAADASADAAVVSEETVKAVAGLPSLLRRCVELRLGIGTNAPMGIDALAQSLDVVPASIKNWQAQALRLLQETLPPADLENLRVRFGGRKRTLPGLRSSVAGSTVGTPSASSDPERPIVAETNGGTPNTSPVAPNPAEKSLETDDGDWMKQAMVRVAPSMRSFMEFRLGIRGESPLSLEQAAERVGFKTSTAKTYQSAALRQLRLGLSTTQADELSARLQLWQRRPKPAVAPMVPKAETIVPPVPTKQTAPVVEPVVEATPLPKTPPEAPPPASVVASPSCEAMNARLSSLEAKLDELLQAVRELGRIAIAASAQKPEAVKPEQEVPIVPAVPKSETEKPAVVVTQQEETGDWLDTASAWASSLSIEPAALNVRLARIANARRRANAQGIEELVYSEDEILNVAADLIHTRRRRAGPNGTFKENGETFGPIPLLAAVLGLEASVVQQRIDRDARFPWVFATDVSGKIVRFHPLTHVRRACADMLAEEANSTPHSALS